MNIQLIYVYCFIPYQQQEDAAQKLTTEAMQASTRAAHLAHAAKTLNEAAEREALLSMRLSATAAAVLEAEHEIQQA